MLQRTLDFFAHGGWINALFGPIFEKELRVSSRQRRSYVVRFVYLTLLTAFVLLCWLSAVRYDNYSPAYRISRMAEAGKIVVMVVAWFQFIALQLVALIMLSTSISDEIHHRTLGALMSTPINSFQIVAGKMASRLLQLTLLLAISVPLMMVVRVFGGVPWEFVIGSSCITLVNVIFAGSLSMFFSVGNRRSYVVILKVLVALAVLFLLIPWAAVMIFDLSERTFASSPLGWFNPYCAMVLETERLMSPGGSLAKSGQPWMVHCVSILGASAAVLAICVMRVRRAALRQAVGEEPPKWLRRRGAAAQADREAAHGQVRRVWGSPILWKELRATVAKKRWRRILLFAAAILIMVATYAIVGGNDLDDNDTHSVYHVVLVTLGILVTSILAATSVSSERESGTWELLLSTPLSRTHIILGKALGSLRRCLPVWSLLAFHVAIFTIAGYMHPMLAVHLALIVSGTVVLLVGTGTFFSSLFRRTTAAVVANLGMVIAVWGVMTLVLVLIGSIVHKNDVGGAYACLNPLCQTIVVTDEAAGGTRAHESLMKNHYDWPPPLNNEGFVSTTAVISATTVVHVGVGVAMSLAAIQLARRRAR